MSGHVKPTLFAALLASMMLSLAPASDAAADGLEERIVRGAANGILDELVGQTDRGERYRDRKWDRDHDRRRHDFKIPAGHYPPPGSCRIWYPDRPAGHQPPPTSCRVRVPHGAYLIRG